ncbi:putative disease resistance RPP13-like protein 1 isoform X1 [Primulina huaijiensis]|uniref:putative disease resistance RPP13-like protein 1 isoform X1 n=1 Tax=Primulina huaijiensis TaxID=1492673 RepID=UPI003CC73F25
MAEGGKILGALLDKALEKLSDAAITAVAHQVWMTSYFDKLHELGILINGVLEDAEDKQLTSKPVKAWLEELRDLTYYLDDVLSEIRYRALVQASKEIQNQKTRNVPSSNVIHAARSKVIHTCRGFMPGGLVFNCRLSSKIMEITNRLDQIAKKKNALSLMENRGSPSSRAGEIRSGLPVAVTESKVYGRDDDMKAIKEMLFTVESSGQNFRVIPIVGMGGIGKSTLAQLLYEDLDVEENFDVRVWVHVSQKFDALKITKMIHTSITKLSDTGDMNLAMLQQDLHEKLKKVKFFIVLDDAWNENYYKLHTMCSHLRFGLPGSKIIVTTRSHGVGSVVGYGQSAYHLKLLTDEDCQCLLAQSSHISFQDNLDLREVGQRLAKKCKGLPLAAEILGGILRSKYSESEWKDVLDSKIWDLPQENILPVLRLSYDHLPSHLRNPFAYCSVLPKDYEFDQNELILLWMGEGFLDVPNEQRRKEDLGHAYFNELLSRSFFQRKIGRDSKFVMHDLIRELANFVSGGVCCHLEEKLGTAQTYQLPKKTRHASFLCHEYEVFHDFESFGQVKGLRTFLPMPVQNPSPPSHMSSRILVELLPRLRSLRTLSLSGYSITELPSSVCKLILLRHLNLSGTLILTLPPSVSDLLCLEILCLSKCRFIHDLPSTLGDLSNLRLLDISDTDQLKEMPVEIGELIHLQTLPKIVLSRVDNLGLKELRLLKQLRGTLAIFDLQNTSNLDDATEADLWGKTELEDLQLSWGSGTVNSQAISAKDVMERLQPHHNLRKLKIDSYKGVNFPDWIGDPLYRKLTSLYLVNCAECSTLPPLGQLPGLEHLHIGGMPRIKCIGIEFYGSGAEVPFERLETLGFGDMQGWEEWSAFTRTDGRTPFPLLRGLTMSKCDKLDDVAPLSLPSLQELEIEECNIVLLKSFCDLENVKNLKVKSIAALSHLPMELMQPTLEVLECRSCNGMQFVWPSKMSLTQLAKLRRMVIAECDQLVSLGEGEQQLPCSLEVLELLHCGSVMSLSNDLSSLEFLRELVIKDCAKFVEFSKNGIPPTTKILEILGCHALKSLPANISDLEILEIKDCSSLKTWKMTNFPATIKKLMIANCNSLDPVTKLMFPKDRVVSLEVASLSNWVNYKHFLSFSLKFSNLFELYLCSCDGLEHFPEHGLPPSLRLLAIKDCKQLRSMPEKICGMRTMKSIEMGGCPELENFPNCGFPPYLSSLSIWECKKFKPLNEWGLNKLNLLEEFSIGGGFEEVEQLGDSEIFPPSLVRLSIAGFPVLNSISKVLGNLRLLRELSVSNCPRLNGLPSKQVLEKLGHLKIKECPLVIKKCLKKNGKYRSKIAGIASVKMEGN